MPNYSRTPGGLGVSTGGQTPVYTTRRINTTAPLTGGGALSSDLTLYLDTATLLDGVALRNMPNVFTQPNYFTAAVRLTAGLTVEGTAQVSGTAIHYSPIYQGSVSDAQRYVTSGEVRTTPGGVDKDVQFNDGSTFGGDAAFQWDKTPNVLTVSGAGVFKTNLLVSGELYVNDKMTLGPRGLNRITVASETSDRPGTAFVHYFNHPSDGGATFLVGRARGTIAQASGLQLGDTLGLFVFQSYLSSISGFYSTAIFGGVAKEAWGAGLQGSYLSARTMTSGDANTVERFRFDSPNLALDTVYRASVASANRYVTSGELAGGSPGGANLDLQFNDASAFGGDSALTWQKTPNILTVSGTEHHYGPVFAGGSASAAGRYITSGEVAPDTGVLNTASTFWTGAAHVFGAATTVTTSGETRLTMGTSGAYIVVRDYEKLVTVSGTATVMVTGMLTGALHGFAARNVTAVSGGGAGFAGICIGISGVATAKTMFGNNLSAAQGTTATFANFSGASLPVFATPRAVQITASGGPRFAGGQIRLVSRCAEVIPPSA